MSHATRPIASFQRPVIGTGELIETRHTVRILAKSTDQMTGAHFYVVQGDKGPAFGVWPDELRVIAYALQVPA